MLRLPYIFMEKGDLVSINRLGEKNKEGEIIILTIKNGKVAKLKLIK